MPQAKAGVMFIDTAQIYVKAGKGGDGCNAFYRLPGMRYRRPHGGDGGKGADVVFAADRNIHTLLDFQYRRHFYAPDGRNGSGNNKKGKQGEDLYVKVPVGTLVRDIQTQCLLKDLTAAGASVVVARGGRGGRGNIWKREATAGEPGEERMLHLELKLLSDVGIVGMPNSGKSTLLSKISSAQPRIAAYPFTTKEPVLGVVQRQTSSFTVAEVPGLIEGAHQGKGLGDLFLRHLERTRLILHLIDMGSSEGRRPWHDYKLICRELEQYNKDLMGRVQVLVANKMDLEGASRNLALFKRYVKKDVIPISALKSEGIEGLLDVLDRLLQESRN